MTEVKKKRQQKHHLTNMNNGIIKHNTVGFIVFIKVKAPCVFYCFHFIIWLLECPMATHTKFL